MRNIAFGITLIAVLLIDCKSQSEVEYNIPKDSKPKDVAELMVSLEKGRILYGIHCASCHTKKVNGKKQIPNFTMSMLSSYKKGLVNSNPQHAASLTPNKVRPEDLNKIMIFFMFKKKSILGDHVSTEHK